MADPALLFPGCRLPDVNNHPFEAVIRDRSSGHHRFFKAGMHLDWFASQIIQQPQATPPFGASIADEAKCRVDNCERCKRNNEKICSKCLNGYRRKRAGKRCKWSGQIVADIDFEEMTFWTQLCELWNQDDSVCATDDLSYVQMNIPSLNGLEVVDDGYQAAALFKGDERVPLPKYCHLTTHWMISFWWKPDTSLDGESGDDRPVRFFTMNRDRGRGFTEEYTISFDHDYIVDSVITQGQEKEVLSNQFVIHVNMYGSEVQCFVNTPITVDQWNKITVRSKNGIITTTANGNVHSTADEDPLVVAVDFCDWHLGDHMIGIKGLVDNIQVIDFEEHGKEDDKLTTAEIVGIVLGTVMGCFICIFWICYCTGPKKDQGYLTHEMSIRMEKRRTQRRMKRDKNLLQLAPRSPDDSPGRGNFKKHGLGSTGRSGEGDILVRN